MPPGKEVECLIDRLKVWPMGPGPILTAPDALHVLQSPAARGHCLLCTSCVAPAAPPQEHFASTGPKKTAAQIKAQQADLMSRLPEVGGVAPQAGARLGCGFRLPHCDHAPATPGSGHRH